MALIFFQNFQSHLHRCHLELYYEIHEYLILVFLHIHALSVLPEIFCDPVCYNWDVLQIIDKWLHVGDFLRKYSAKRQLSPWRPFLVFINQGQLQNLSYRQVCFLIQFDFFTFCSFLDQRKCVVHLLVHERMLAEVNEVQKTSRWPNIALCWVFLVHELLRRSINWSSFVEREIASLGNVLFVDASGTSEIGNFDDWAFADENVFRLEVSMNYSFYIHDNEGLDNLFKYFENLLNGDAFLFFVVIEEVALGTVLHGDLE